MPAAYQDENGKWWKECSSTKQLFGGVDTKEELIEWFSKDKVCKSDGFRTECREANRKIRKQYRQNNLEKIKEEKKRYRQKNVEKIKVYNKDYKRTAAGLWSKYKHNAKKRGINFTLTLEWFEEQMTKPEFNVCYFTGIKFVDELIHPFSRSLDRISSTKGYTPDNVRWVCFKLNSWKSDLTLDEVAIIFNAMAKHHNADPFEVLKKVA